MSAFVEKAMWFARQCELSIEWGIRHDETRDALRAHLEAREAVTRQLAEALRALLDGNPTEDELGKARQAIQAYDEASNEDL